MFEERTYEAILSDMLSRVSSDIDKREGSIIYDALAPCAYQLAQAYFMLDNFIDLVSGDTAVGEYLDRVVADYGITRKPATQALRKIETNVEIVIGSRWGFEDTAYVVVEMLSTNVYSALCEQTGTIGNQYSGELENIDNVSGVTAMLTDVLTPGADVETDDNLRTRFYNQIQRPSTSGNVDNYIKWALEVPGVGDVKVFPLWDGPGTVKLLIVDSNLAIDPSLEDDVYNHVEEVRPIGASVTVTSPGGKSIGVTADVFLDGSRTLGEVQADFTTGLSEYLKETVFDVYTVSYARIGSILLSTQGIEDYTNLLVNGGTANISLAESELPIIGSISLSEVV